MTKLLNKKRNIALVLVLAFFVLLALLPFFISSTSALHFFVSSVNKKIPGEISIDSWLIDWSQGVLCKNVAYDYPEKGINIFIPSLTTNRGLVGFVMEPKNLGTVQMETPQVTLSGETVTSFFVKGRSKTAAGEKRIDSAEDSPPFWERVVVDLKSRDGLVTIEWKDEGIAISLEGLSVDSSLSSSVAQFDVGFQTQDQGFVEVSGSFNLPAHKQGWLDTIITETEMKVELLQLKDFLAIGSLIKPSFPKGEGVLNADIQLKTVGLEGIDINGLAEVTDVMLSGGLLGDDQPSFQKIHLSINQGGWTNRGWNLNSLELFSDTIDLKVAGQISSQAQRLKASGVASLPVLFDQFPRLLKVNETTLVETGTFDFTIDVNAEQAKQKIKLKAKVNNIGGVSEGNQFSWGAPATLLFNGEKNDDGLEIQALKLDAPFANANGSGALQSFGLDAELDLQRALTDLGTLFQLDLEGSGVMELTMKNLSEKVGGKEGFRVFTDLNINQFMLRHHDKLIVPHHHFSLAGEFSAPNTFFSLHNGELDAQLNLDAWFGKMFLTLNGINNNEAGFNGYFTTASELDFIQATPLLHILNFLENDTRVSGKTNLRAAGSIDGNATEIRDFSAQATGFLLERNGNVFSDPNINIEIVQPVINNDASFLTVRDLKIIDSRNTFFQNDTGLNLVDFSLNTLTLHNVWIKTETGTATIDKIMIPDWQKPFENALTQASLSLDLSKITQGFHALEIFSQDTSLSGSSEMSVLWTEKGELSREVDVQFYFADFTLKRRGITYVDSDDVIFSLRANGQVPFGTMTVDSIHLESKTLNMEAAGNTTFVEEQQFLEVQGKYTSPLEQISLIIRNELGYDLIAHGQLEEQFTLRYPISSIPDEKNNKLKIDSNFHTEKLVVNGFEIDDVVMPFHLEGNALHLDLSGRMNDGTVTFVSDIDISDTPPVVTIPDNSQILKDTNINPFLVQKLLSRIHTLFGGLTTPSGSFDVRMDSFRWPFSGQGEDEASFVVIIDVSEVQLESRQQFKEVQALFGLDANKLELKDNEIYCIGKNGSIQCSPLHLLTGDSEIVITGTVSRDRSIDYIVEFPVTRKLFNEEGYRILEGTKVKAVLQGTAESPLFDKEDVRSSIHSLMTQAAKEIKKTRDKTEQVNL